MQCIVGETISFKALEDEFSPDLLEFHLEADDAQSLTRIDQDEVEAASTIWHRQHVVFVCETSGR